MEGLRTRLFDAAVLYVTLLCVLWPFFRITMRRSVGEGPPHTPTIRVRRVKRQGTRLLSISWHTGFCPGMDKVWVECVMCVCDVCVCVFVMCICVCVILWRLDM